jgi:hypothetical protein
MAGLTRQPQQRGRKTADIYGAIRDRRFREAIDALQTELQARAGVYAPALSSLCS